MDFIICGCVFLLFGILLGMAISERWRKPTEYVDDNTAEEVREGLFRIGLTDLEIGASMTEMRRRGIIFMKQSH